MGTAAEELRDPEAPFSSFLLPHKNGIVTFKCILAHQNKNYFSNSIPFIALLQRSMPISILMTVLKGHLT